MSMGTASTSPQKISEPTLTSKIPATPTGLGVAGTIVCVMTRPHARAMPIDTMDFRISEEIALTSGVRMMKPELQKIWIETRKPVMAMADLLASLAEKLQEGERHALRGAGDLEQLPHHDAEADDDADAAERAAEPLGDARDNLLIADAADDADDDCRDDENEERTRSFLTASQASRSDMWRLRKKTRRPSTSNIASGSRECDNAPRISVCPM